MARILDLANEVTIHLTITVTKTLAKLGNSFKNDDILYNI
jgi:hypothetical protein